MTSDPTNTPPKTPSPEVHPVTNQTVTSETMSSANSQIPGKIPSPAPAQSNPQNAIVNKLSKFGEGERAPRRFDQPNPTAADPRVQTLHDAVKDLVRSAQQNEGGKVRVDSRTDVQRHLKVATHQEEELLLVNTDVYIPGQWFIRKQWRRVGDEPGDDFFLKSARNKGK